MKYGGNYAYQKKLSVFYFYVAFQIIGKYLLFIN